MKKIFHIIKFFFIYRKNVLKNRQYLKTKYGLNIDRVNRLWTTISLTDAPQELKEKYGEALGEFEVKKYINNFNKDLAKIELDELVNVYPPIEQIDKYNYGITFGYSLMNNVIFYFYALLIILVIILIPVLIFIL